MNEQTFSTAFVRVKELVENFQVGEQTYLEAKYSEAQARLDFIDKFWMALGWDVSHEREKNPYKQEVKVERGVAVSNRLKKADYAFFAAPNFRDVKFYVEAKKPSRNLDNTDDYFQTIRYGWSSNTPIAVLTDFEQFRVIDCRYKPNINTATNFALKKIDYREYADEAKFREIYHLFSREAVLDGAIEEYAANLPKRGKGKLRLPAPIQKSVDESFLDDLDAYREQLARAFKNKNAELDGEDLTEAVTRTIDRLVFIRFLEDKLIEPDTMMDKFDSWADFVRTSARLNTIYNGIVFKQHFIDSPDFNADDKVFADICGELSDKNTPYYFGYIPVHILGSVYERFLGKVIVATDKRATVQEKPEVRKAGGVYYTPEYIVRYIVENTIGKLLEGGNLRVSKGAEGSNDENTLTNVRVSAKTPEEISEMRFADIACGSGSFLLGVYDYLLRYHTTYYNETGKKGEARTASCIENADGSFTLSIAQRREILRNNIYGVDVDAQATEVAQLSLALKLLEDATVGTVRVFQPKFGEKILPDMTKNIVCGNSLIDHDILDGQLFERNEERKLNPMSYEDKFPEIMRRGGFDAIVGNPPWGAALNSVEKDYLVKHFSSFQGNHESYLFFIEKVLELLKSDGLVSLITPDSWIKIPQAQRLRRIVLEMTSLNLIVTLPQKVFLNVSANCVIFVSAKNTKTSNCLINILHPKSTLQQLETKNFDESYSIDASIWKKSNDNQFQIFQKAEVTKLIGKLKSNSQEAVNYLDVMQGIVPYSKESHSPKIIEQRGFHASEKLSDEYDIWIQGRAISRFFLNTEKKEYLKYGLWLHRPRKAKYFNGQRILIQEITGGHPPRISACFCDITLYHDPGIISCLNISNFHSFYLLGIINSRLISWFHQYSSPKGIRHTFPKVLIGDIRNLPIRAINFDVATEKAAHDKMVSLVEQMLEMKKILQTARTDKDKTFYQDRCNALDRQIDNLVYVLYALTPEEIEIVEGK